ncbi:GDSL-type esterase/lipase family protein [Saccharicrinis sp. FJH2]|uniref:GDSL-type esterase/lipase family protein n=1 Tax=Saccharicrinis sp. FJH65 TaxID=3344659 RepID=UPI0035F4F857
MKTQESRHRTQDNRCTNVFHYLNPFLIFILMLFVSCNRTYNPTDTELVFAEQPNINIDGQFDDWDKVDHIRIFSDEFGNVPGPKDLKAQMSAAWAGEGIYLYFEINDDINYIHPDSCCKSDAIDIFISPDKGKDDIVQYSIPLTFHPNGDGIIYVTDHRKKCYLRSVGPSQKAMGRTENGTTKLEVFIATEAIGKKPQVGSTLSLQIYVNDPDMKNDPDMNSLKLYAGNFSNETSFTHYPVRLGKAESKLYETTSKATVTDDKDITLAITGFTGKGDLAIYKGDQLVKELSIENNDADKAIEIDPGAGFDAMNDTLSVVLNGQTIGFHNLIVSPRKYVHISAPRFYESFNIFHLKDRISFPKPDGALFIGSSSMRLWGSVHEDFPELNVIHRGFGGSNSKDVLAHMKDIVLPYNPAMIVYYEGDNDIVDKFPLDTIISNMEQFISEVQANRADTKIYFLSPKPSIARMAYGDQYKELHQKMKDMVKTHNDVYYVDVSTPMFNADGTLKKDIFCKDNLHMVHKGYIIWKHTLREALGL